MVMIDELILFHDDSLMLKWKLLSSLALAFAARALHSSVPYLVQLYTCKSFCCLLFDIENLLCIEITSYILSDQDAPHSSRPFLEAVLLHMIVILCDVEYFQSYAIVVQKRFKVNEEDLSNIVKM